MDSFYRVGFKDMPRTRAVMRPHPQDPPESFLPEQPPPVMSTGTTIAVAGIGNAEKPQGTARFLVDGIFSDNRKCNTLHFKGDWWKWTGEVWRRMAPGMIEQTVFRTVERYGGCATEEHVRRVVYCLENYLAWPRAPAVPPMPEE